MLDQIRREFELADREKFCEIFPKSRRQFIKDNPYYFFLSCAVKVLNPKVVIECGTAEGLSALAIAHNLKGKLYTIDVNPRAGWMVDDPKVVKITGGDEVPETFRDIDISSADMWFIDSVHEASHLRAQFELYLPKLKKGALILFDDIDDRDMREGLSHLPFEITNLPELHPNQGFGATIV